MHHRSVTANAVGHPLPAYVADQVAIIAENGRPVPGIPVISQIALIIGENTILPELLRAFADYRMLAYSVVLVLVMIFRPQGIFGSWEFSLPRLVNRMLFRGAAGKGAKPAASAKQHDQSDDKTVKEASR